MKLTCSECQISNFIGNISWDEEIDTCFNVECVLLGRNFDFCGGYLVVTARYLAVCYYYYYYKHFISNLHSFAKKLQSNLYQLKIIMIIIIKKINHNNNK